MKDLGLNEFPLIHQTSRSPAGHMPIFDRYRFLLDFNTRAPFATTPNRTREKINLLFAPPMRRIRILNPGFPGWKDMVGNRCEDSARAAIRTEVFQPEECAQRNEPVKPSRLY